MAVVRVMEARTARFAAAQKMIQGKRSESRKFVAAVRVMEARTARFAAA